MQIRALRAGRTSSEISPARGTTYVVRQFKRPEEIDMMRRVYGRKFIQVSVYGSAAERRQVLMDKIRRFDSSPKADADCESQAIELIDIDNNEGEDKDGQRISDVFHLGDVFVSGIDKALAEQTIDRFVPDKVYFQPFIGISPRRYRDIFEKRKRKDENGKAIEWSEGKPAPLLEDRSAAYIENEEPSAYVALKYFQKRKSKSGFAKQASVA
jgi:hypothetical protein